MHVQSIEDYLSESTLTLQRSRPCSCRVITKCATLFDMDKAVQERIGRIEAEIKLIKRAVLQSPDFSVDEKNWQKMRGTIKKVRSKLYKERYA